MTIRSMPVASFSLLNDDGEPDGFAKTIYGPPYKVFGVYHTEGHEDYKYFSFISREILTEYDPSIDILLYVNFVRGTVDLRTASDHIDVSRIAHLNGGGGHPKAAGFPLR